ncbi:MAG: hypothetical protein ACI4GY_08165, partial [Acutalibacteraceae bacterium]
FAVCGRRQAFLKKSLAKNFTPFFTWFPPRHRYKNLQLSAPRNHRRLGLQKSLSKKLYSFFHSVSAAV